MKGRIEQIAYIGWRGIDYEAIALDREAFTGLIGPSGAGKSTLVMCLDYALLPDRRVMDIRPISDVQDPHLAGTDTLLTRINPTYGYAYVALDIRTRHGTRLIAGIHARGEDGRGELSRFYIDNYPVDAPLQDAFRIVDGDGQYYPDFQELNRHLAAQGIDLHVCRSVPEYGQVLYDAGVLPTNLADSTDRSLYSKLIETSFRGGISADVATKLKDYLLPEERYVPEIVTKLQDCTAQVFSTRRALGDADRQLSLLQATYGTAKEIVLHALRNELGRQEEASCAISARRKDVEADKEDLARLNDSLQVIEGQIKTTEGTIRTLQDNAQSGLETEEALMGTLADDEQTKKSAHEVAKAKFQMFRKGEKAWQRAAGDHAGETPAWVEKWLDSESERLSRATVKYEGEIEKRQNEIATLEVGASNPKTATLARALGAQTLEEAFNEVPDDEARALEMSLCGMVDGVVGIPLDDLLHLEASEHLPDMFWLGDEPPQASKVKEVGDWLFTAGAGGYIVSSKAKHPFFGQQARADHIRRLTDEINGLMGDLKAVRIQREGEDGEGGLKGRLKQLQTNSEAINFFIAHRNEVATIEAATAGAKEAYEKASRLHGEAQEKVKQLRQDLFKVSKPHEEALEAMKTQWGKTSDRIKEIEKRLPGQVKGLEDAEQALVTLQTGFATMLTILGQPGEEMLASARELEPELSAVYIAGQTRRIIELGNTLADELAERRNLIQQSDPLDAASCVRLWPMLIEVLRDRIVLDLTDMDGTDLLSTMRSKRSGLNEQLRLQEGEVKVQAKSIHSAIRSAMMAQRNRIKLLSRMGENIHFGNVVGIRITVQTQDKLLDMLESFADQMTLFSDNAKPVDQALDEFFQKAGDQYKFTGEELLDYRTYMDLVIEAKRKGKEQGEEWHPASSLSGGESIGGGLAIALMLSRALSARGELKPEQITPLFAIDEVHRLDPKGQGMIVEFAKREGFQVFVTASALKPSYECTLYSLERIYDPDERLVIRGLEKRAA